MRKRQRYYLEQGINAVPAVIINERHLIQGGQPAQVFEQALRPKQIGAAGLQSCREIGAAMAAGLVLGVF